MKKQAQQPATEPAGSVAPLGWKIAGWLALTVYFLLPPREAMSWGLDSSNYGSYAWMLATGRQFGADTVAMTGPFGFLAYGHTYSGYLFFEYLVGDLLFKAAFAFLVVQLFARFQSGLWRWLWLFALLVFLPSVDDLVYDIAILLAAVALLTGKDGKAGALTTGVAAVLLGFSVLMKGSHATLAGVSLAFVALNGFLDGKRRRALVIVSVALGTFFAGWLLAGQPLRNLPGYFHAILALTSGYNSAMGLDAEPRMLVAGLVIAAGLSIALVLNLTGRQQQPAHNMILVFFALFAFLQWKHGFVRADGHVFMFFGFAAIFAPLLQMTMWTAANSASEEKKMMGTALLSVLTFLAAAVATSSFSVGRFAELASKIPGQLTGNFSYLASPEKTKGQRTEELNRQRELAALPDIRRDVGTASIDFFGYEQGILLLNDLNYRPRPMGGGSFNVYHPHLQKLNAQFMSDGSQRPDFFLLKLQTIDGRLPAADDPLTLEALLASYQPIRAQRDYVLFEKSTGPSSPKPEPHPIGQHPVALGEWLDVPTVAADALLLFSLDLGSSLGGTARAVAYHPPTLSVEIQTGPNSHAESFRLSPLSLRVPVLLSPLLADSSDVVALYGKSTGVKNVQRIRLVAPSGGFARSGSVSFYTLPQPRESPDAAAEILSYLKQPRSNRPPLAISTQETGITELFEEPVTLVHAPGSITFPVEQNDQRLIFSFGMMPQSYDPGETDGVEFIVEYLPDGHPPQILYRRLLQPHTVARDRGMHSARIFFPPNADPGRVRIRTEPGPAGNGAWDQSYVAHVQILTGPFDPRQLNGFSVAPESPGFPDPTIVPVEGREARSFPPPGELKFSIPSNAQFVTVGLGVLAAAYEGENHSDGIGFAVVAITPDGQEKILQSQNLDPAHDWRARGTVTVDFPLPTLPNGSLLALRINGGPKQDLRWDWSYVQTVRFR